MTKLETAAGERVISDEDIDRWRRDGYVVVEGVFDEGEVAAAMADVDALAPSFEDVRDHRAEPPPWLRPFPFSREAADNLVLHPTLVDFAERALGTDVVLSHSEMLHKYAGFGEHDQWMHQDWGNNSLIVPSESDPDQVASITYLTDVTLEMSPTAVVSYGEGAPWRHQIAWTREDAPELYELEHLVVVPAGSTVFYTMRTFHRGTALTGTSGCRHSLHVAFQRASATWAGWRGLAKEDWTWSIGYMTQLSPKQRSVIGFPKPDDPVWTEDVLASTQLRYPEMDLSAYGR